MNRFDSESKTLLAFAGTCLVPGLFFAVAWPLSGVRTVASVATTAVIVTLWSGTAVFGIGGPLYLLCKHWGLLGWPSALFGGLLGGLIVWGTLPSDRPLELSLIGLASGAAFWSLYKLLHRQRRSGHEG